MSFGSSILLSESFAFSLSEATTAGVDTETVRTVFIVTGAIEELFAELFIMNIKQI